MSSQNPHLYFLKGERERERVFDEGSPKDKVEGISENEGTAGLEGIYGNERPPGSRGSPGCRGRCRCWMPGRLEVSTGGWVTWMREREGGAVGGGAGSGRERSWEGELVARGDEGKLVARASSSDLKK
ncbi:hypothetical protein QJS04_geneDACA016773 [Acorus gramineus]|uniref:Uncharacterized protein n=1 Tax=Acorus gramineus TaxID=55184 RepID=A0AAV9BJA1_ACOGR|nr:hypothetical protein QJS04_geneDACA016773 [Acorus gramineus]